MRTRHIGSLVKRGVIALDNQLYVLNLYRRGDVLTCDLIPYTDRKADRRNMKRRHRGQYTLDTTKMLNISGTPLYDYVIAMIVIEGGLLKFREHEFHSIE